MCRYDVRVADVMLASGLDCLAHALHLVFCSYEWLWLQHPAGTAFKSLFSLISVTVYAIASKASVRRHKFGLAVVEKFLFDEEEDPMVCSRI